MSMTDPIADLLTRMRNAIRRRYETVDVPSSDLKQRILEILKDEGFIIGFKVTEEDPKRPVIRVALRYIGEERPVITGMRRVSRPGRRVYLKRDKIRPVRGGLGVAVLSTSSGLMTDRESRRRKLGGELICEIW